MAYVDVRSGEVVVTVVYDGAPDAGKTTNVSALHKTTLSARAGEMVSHEQAQTTRWFDWRDFRAGVVDGRPLRCRIWSVPGQLELRRRRLMLLDFADCIVFVVDARAAAVPESLKMLAAWRLLGAGRDVPLVLQANKRDLPGALAPEAVRSALGLGDDIPAVGAVAKRAEGVLQTFLIATRLAMRGAKNVAPLADQPGTPAELLAEMQALDDTVD